MRLLITIALLFNVAFGQSLFGVVAGDGVDADYRKFIIAANITDTNQRRAVKYLVKALKDSSLWSKMIIVYPAVGGSASSHSYNLRDTATFKMTFPNGATHNSSGIGFNGSNQYANTNFNPGTQLSAGNIHTSYYSKTNSDGVFCDLGVTNLANTAMVTIYSRLSNNALSDAGGDFRLARMSGSSTDSRAFLISTKTTTTSGNLYRNGTSIASTTNSSSDLPNGSIYLNAVNNIGGTISQYSNRTCSFVSIGTGLSANDARALNNIVTQYQTILGRQN